MRQRSKSAKDEFRSDAFSGHLEKTLQYLLYYHLLTDSKFRSDFIKWSGLKGLGDPKRTVVQVERPGKNVRFDLKLIGVNGVERNIELKVWAPFTEGQSRRNAGIDLVIAPAGFDQLFGERKMVSWQDLAKRFPNVMGRVGDFLHAGDDPDEESVLSELTMWWKSKREFSPELVNLFLTKVWWYAGGPRINGWRASSYWSRSRTQRYLGYVYEKKIKTGTVYCWIGFIWDLKVNKAALMIEVSGAFDERIHSSLRRQAPPRWFHPDWYSTHRNESIIASITGIEKLDAAKVANKLRQVLEAF